MPSGVTLFVGLVPGQIFHYFSIFQGHFLKTCGSKRVERRMFEFLMVAAQSNALRRLEMRFRESDA